MYGKKFLTIILFFACSSWVMAQTAPQQASNLLNPNISVIGNGLVYFGGDRHLPKRAFSLSEVEIGFQSAIDPFARGDFFVAVKPEKVELEEGYFSWLVLPAGGTIKAGRFRSALGAFNRIHLPETGFADRPLPVSAYLGDEGLVGNGVSLSYLLPLREQFAEWEFEITDVWEGAPVFSEINPATGRLEAGGSRDALGYLTRLSSFTDLSDRVSLLGGVSYVRGPVDSAATRFTDIWEIDFRMKIRDPARIHYQGLDWRSEIFFVRQKQATEAVRAMGFFSYLELRIDRPWIIGGRFDYAESLQVGAPPQRALLGYITYKPSEFQSLSLQGRGGAVFLKWTIGIGPHAAHTF